MTAQRPTPERDATDATAEIDRLFRQEHGRAVAGEMDRYHCPQHPNRPMRVPCATIASA
jgi:hypothetical protein